MKKTRLDNLRLKNRPRKEYNYTVIFEPAEEGGYNIVVPALPEICTQGHTLAEAKQMAVDAIRLVIESALEFGEPIPPDVVIRRKPVIERVSISL